MVRARAVEHPSEWGRFSGYNEIQNPNRRYSLIDHRQLAILLGKDMEEDLVASHAHCIEEALERENRTRDARWSGSIAVGSKEFVEEAKEELGALFESRKVEGKGEQYELHERQIPFNCRSIPEIDPPGATNAYLWQ